MKKITTIILLAILGLTINSMGQTNTIKVLFLGNSYTSVNNLPQMIANVAKSTGDTIVFDSNTPGGCTLMQHSTNPTSLAKIASENWDFVVLQEQSQYPSFPIAQVEAEVFPYAKLLDSIINRHNACTETVFYMTWGRKNGDTQNCASWPPVCTYNGMDSLLNLRYRMMADSNNAILSPVGEVWKYIRNNFPSIELYQTDESHPSVAGSYAAACCFYTTFLRKDPTLITFNSTLSPGEAANIRTATKLIVYDSLMKWHIGEYDPHADFTYTDLDSGNIAFINHSLHATSYFWEFGDGNFSQLSNPTHFYSMEGNELVKLFAYNCSLSDSSEQTITITYSAIKEQNPPCLKLFPNPTSSSVTLYANSNFFGSSFMIFNFFGEIVMKGKIRAAETSIDLKKFSSGVYIIRINDRSNSALKVIKK